MIDDHHSGPLFRQAEDPYEGKSFQEVLREKREAIERSLALKQPKDPVKDDDLEPHSQHDMPDSVEARKKRLQAQRDALI